MVPHSYRGPKIMELYSFIKHGTPRPPKPNTFDGEAFWCAYCKRYIEVAPVIGGLQFLLTHPDCAHGPKP